MDIAVKTNTDPNAESWSMTDEIVRFRIWGTARTSPVPKDEREIFVGAEEASEIRITDPKGFCSGKHARIYRADGGRWFLHNLSKNGTWVDESRRDEPFEICAGMELRFGSITLIAESARFIALRGLLSRMIGWKDDRTKIVDLALRRLHMAAMHRTPIVLCSPSDPVALAYSIHRVAFGAERPFVVCNPRRKETSETVRSATNVARATEALSAAAGGSMCIVAGRVPSDFDEAFERLEDPGSRVQLIVCSPKVIDAKPYRTAPIVVPPMSARLDELTLIVDEYAGDALSELGGRREYHYKTADRAWVIGEESRSLSTIQTATLRLVALRMTRNVTRAATRLGMARASLKGWIGRREMPMHLEPDE
ncbi:MAG: FHA domain-containing protein [Kofleriaceae bacterium]